MVPDADRWKRIDRIYQDVAERPVTERSAFLAEACGTDDALRHEIESLLAKDGLPFLEESVLDVAARDLTQVIEPSWVGRALGGYESWRWSAAGGMGEVYRARDTTLGREVALKLLPQVFAADPDRVRRLEREARMLASLNHPNIATLYGVEE